MEIREQKEQKCADGAEIISVLTGKVSAKVKIDDIEYIEQEGRKLAIVTAEKTYTLYGKMESMAACLVGRSFYRPMKSLIVNFDKIDSIEGGVMFFSSGKCMSIGRNNMTKLKKAYRAFLMKYPPFSFESSSENSPAGEKN